MAQYSEALKNAFLEAQLSDFASIEKSKVPEHTEKYLRKMKILLKRDKTEIYKLFNTAGKRAAAICLVSILAVAACMSVGAVREPIIRTIEKIMVYRESKPNTDILETKPSEPADSEKSESYETDETSEETKTEDSIIFEEELPFVHEDTADTASNEVKTEIDEIAITEKTTDEGFYFGKTYWIYDKETRTLTVSGSGAIPDSTENESTKRDSNGIYNAKKVIVGEGITKIGAYSFNRLINLSEVVLPSTLEAIGKNAFEKCDSLKDITIPDKVDYIGENAFKDSPVETVSVSAKLPRMASAGFENVRFILRGETEKGSLPAYFMTTVKGEISSNLKWYYDSERQLLIFIGSGKLYDRGGSANARLECRDAVSVVLDDRITYIGKGAFSNFKNISSFGTLPKSLTEIADGAFENQKGEIYLSASDSLTKIGERAFASSGIRTAIIPKGVTEIGKSAFSGSKIEKVTFKDGTTEISENMFDECSELKEVIFAPSIKKVGKKAFNKCSSLVKVDMGSMNVDYFGSSMFFRCTSLRKAVVPNGADSLSSTFINCYELSDISLPSSIRRIENGAFNNDLSDKTITFRGTKSEWDSIVFDEKTTISNYKVIFSGE